jgi:hypothetical protein
MTRKWGNCPPNDALNRLIAKTVEVAKLNVTLERGASARVNLRIGGKRENK